MPRCSRMAWRSVAKNAPLPGLSMTGSPGCRVELGDDVVAGLAAHQDAAHRTGIADAGRAAAADLLGRRQIEQVGPMALARVEHRQAGGAPGLEQRAVRLDRPPQLRHVVAEHFAEAARLEEVALHVDDEQRERRGIEREGIGFGREFDDLTRHRRSPRSDALRPHRPPALGRRASTSSRLRQARTALAAEPRRGGTTDGGIGGPRRICMRTPNYVCNTGILHAHNLVLHADL